MNFFSTIILILSFNFSYGQESSKRYLGDIYSDFVLNIGNVTKQNIICDTVIDFNFETFEHSILNKREECECGFCQEKFFVLYKEKKSNKIFEIEINSYNYKCRLEVFYSGTYIYFIGYPLDGGFGDFINGFFVLNSRTKKIYFVGFDIISGKTFFRRKSCSDIKNVMLLDSNLFPIVNYRFNNDKLISKGDFNYREFYTEEVFSLTNINHNITTGKIYLEDLNTQFNKCVIIPNKALTIYRTKPNIPLWYCHPCKTTEP